MKWFRSNIRLGSRTALFALAVQFVLSFGHFHGTAAQAASAVQSSLAQSGLSDTDAPSTPDAANLSARQQSPVGHDSDQQSNDACSICAVIALANAILFATPPLLLLPQAAEFSYRTTDAGVVHLNSAHVAFQPRAPPIS